MKESLDMEMIHFLQKMDIFASMIYSKNRNEEIQLSKRIITRILLRKSLDIPLNSIVLSFSTVHNSVLHSFLPVKA